MVKQKLGYILAATFGALQLERPFVGFLITLGGTDQGTEWRVTMTHGAYGPAISDADLLKGIADMRGILKKSGKQDLTKLISVPISATYIDDKIASWNFVEAAKG